MPEEVTIPSKELSEMSVELRNLAEKGGKEYVKGEKVSMFNSVLR